MKKALLCAAIALAPLAANAQATLTAETTQTGSMSHYIETTLAAVLESAGVATLQITEGAKLTNSVHAVAEGQLDMAPVPLIMPFLLSRGIELYSGIGFKKGAELAANIRVLFFDAGSAQMFGHCNSNPVEDIRKFEGLRIWNGPPRGAVLTLGRAIFQLLSGREIALAAAGGVTIFDVPSDLLASELGQLIAAAPGHAPCTVPIEEFRAAYAWNDITVVTDDDSFATAFGQIVPASMDEELV